MVSTRSRSNSVSVFELETAKVTTDDDVGDNRKDSEAIHGVRSPDKRSRPVISSTLDETPSKTKVSTTAAITTTNKVIAKSSKNSGVAGNGDDDNGKTATATKRNITGSTSSRNKEQRKEQEHRLRMKSTGMGVIITANPMNDTTTSNTTSDVNGTTSTSQPIAPINRKIVFADMDDDEIVPMNDRKDEYTSSSTGNDSFQKNLPTTDDGNDEDEDMVEEVEGTTAKDQIRMEIQQHRQAQHFNKPTKKKKRNAASKRSFLQQLENDGTSTTTTADNMDDDFFQQLQYDQGQMKKKMKQNTTTTTISNHNATTQSKHTTFIVVDHDDNHDDEINHMTTTTVIMEETTNGSLLRTKREDTTATTTNKNATSNVVILNDSSTQPSFQSTNLDIDTNNNITRFYSRLGCIDRPTTSTTVSMVDTKRPSHSSHSSSSSQRTTKNKKQQQKAQEQPSWTRSKKMNHIASVPSHIRRRGKAAIQFTTTTNRTIK